MHQETYESYCLYLNMTWPLCTVSAEESSRRNWNKWGGTHNWSSRPMRRRKRLFETIFIAYGTPNAGIHMREWCMWLGGLTCVNVGMSTSITKFIGKSHQKLNVPFITTKLRILYSSSHGSINYVTDLQWLAVPEPVTQIRSSGTKLGTYFNKQCYSQRA